MKVNKTLLKKNNKTNLYYLGIKKKTENLNLKKELFYNKHFKVNI